MLPDIFYTTDATQSIPLILLDKSTWQTDNQTLDSYDRACLMAQSFTGAVREVALIYDDKGSLLRVYLGGE